MNAETALATFEGDPVAVVVIGRDGKQRVWLADVVMHDRQHEWASRQIAKASATALQMQPGTGTA